MCNPLWGFTDWPLSWSCIRNPGISRHCHSNWLLLSPSACGLVCLLQAIINLGLGLSASDSGKAGKSLPVLYKVLYTAWISFWNFPRFRLELDQITMVWNLRQTSMCSLSTPCIVHYLGWCPGWPSVHRANPWIGEGFWLPGQVQRGALGSCRGSWD